MRAWALLVTVALAGCGSDTSSSGGADLSAAVDLAGGAKSCGSDGVMLSCAAVSGDVACYLCYAGFCAKPCLLLAPDCPSGQQCHELHPADGGITQVIIEGSGCADYGYCR